MALATKSKNYSNLLKSALVILSILSIIGSVFCTANVVKVYDIYDNKAKTINDSKEDFALNSHKAVYETYDIIDSATYLLSKGYTRVDDETLEKIEVFYNTSDNEDEYYNLIDNFCNLSGVKTLKYYIINTENNDILTNFDEADSIDNLLDNHKFAFQIIDGTCESTNTLSAEYFLNEDGMNGYFYFDVDDDEDPYDYNDRLAEIINVANQAKEINVKLYGIIAVALAILSVVLAIAYLSICGNKDENGKIKQIFIDYVPADIHFIISVGLGILLGIGFVGCVDWACISRNCEYLSYNELRFAFLTMGACVGGIQFLLIELISSFKRMAKSGRKWYKQIFCALIGYGIVKLIKKLIAFFSYKPYSFKKRLITFLASYGALNVLFVFMGIVWYFDAHWDGIGVIMGIINNMLWLGMNVASVVFVTLYVINLDKIIEASHNRTIPQVNYQKLPKSLKMLVDSMRYTNTELNNAVEKAVRDERMRTELITNVSHDLKTPLTSIINYVDLLKTCDINDENAKEYISVLDEKGSKLKRLIEDLIEASKVTSGVINLNPVNLNLSELSTEAVVEHQQEFIDNSLELVFKGDKNSVVAFADGNKTYRVIENLLSNAKKYSAKGSRVYADVFEENNTAIFEIKNISAEPLDISAQELKERFVRGDKSRTNEGNGLGLSIADNLCKAMGGRLELIIDGDLFKARVILPKSK